MALSVASFVVSVYYFTRAMTLQDSFQKYLQFLETVPGPRPNVTEREGALVMNEIEKRVGIGFVFAFLGIMFEILMLLFYRSRASVDFLPQDT